MSKSGRQDKYIPMHLDLVQACKKGDRKAQYELYKLYHGAMYNSALRIVKDPDDAEDVMQEAFIKAFLKLNTYKGEVAFGAWLKKIVINKALDFIRVKKEFLPIEEIEEQEDTDAEQFYLEEGITPEDVKKAIYQLPEGYRLVLSLILLEGYDHEEVCKILGISNATSRTQYHRAKKKLAALLGNK